MGMYAIGREIEREPSPTYTVRFSGLSEWLSKYWDTILLVVGIFLTSIGLIGKITRSAISRAREEVDRRIPKDEKLTEEEFQALIDRIVAMYPSVNRAELEAALRRVLGDRVPQKKKKAGVSPWVWVALGVGAYLLLGAGRG